MVSFILIFFILFLKFNRNAWFVANLKAVATFGYLSGIIPAGVYLFNSFNLWSKAERYPVVDDTSPLMRLEHVKK